MSLKNVISPYPFRLSRRSPNSVRNFQVATFESAKRAANQLRPITLHAGTALMRNVEKAYGKSGHEARKVPPAASQFLEKRWSGLIEGTDIARGALYTSLDPKGLLNEAMRYHRNTFKKEIRWKHSASGKATYEVFGPSTKDYEKLQVERVYYKFELLHDLRVVDLTPAVSARFYEAIEQNSSYQKAKSELGLQVALSRIAFDPFDYTGSRPLGLSVLLADSLHGIRAPTAQSEAPELAGPGVNIALSGSDGEELPSLEPVAKLVAGTSGGHPALLEISLDGSQTDSTVVVPGSVLYTTDE